MKRRRLPSKAARPQVAVLPQVAEWECLVAQVAQPVDLLQGVSVAAPAAPVELEGRSVVPQVGLELADPVARGWAVGLAALALRAESRELWRQKNRRAICNFGRLAVETCRSIKFTWANLKAPC